jgi:putative hydrolase of HD superfamily
MFGIILYWVAYSLLLLFTLNSSFRRAMHVKANNPAQNLPAAGTLPLIQLYFEFNHLKQLYRQGWLQRGLPVEQCESVAEHSFGVAVLGLLLCDQFFPQLDALRVMRLALLHDFGEIDAGDITPEDALPAEEKQSRERAAVSRLFHSLPGGSTYIHLWEEYENGETPEARLVRQIDRLEMAMQASVYAFQAGLAPDEFYASARAALHEPALQGLLDELTSLQPAQPYQEKRSNLQDGSAHDKTG